MKKIHGGNIYKISKQLNCEPENIIDFSSSINPLGSPECIKTIMFTAFSIQNYPDPQCDLLKKAISNKFHIPTENIATGNGVSELLAVIGQLIRNRKVSIISPAYIDYELVCRNNNCQINFITTSEENSFLADLKILQNTLPTDSVVFIANPANPSGKSYAKEKLKELIKSRPDLLFIIDEAFIDFLEKASSLLPEISDNVIILRSMTKFYAIAGIRLGFAVSSKQLIKKIRQLTPAWSVNRIAQEIGTKILNNSSEFSQKSIANITSLREILKKELAEFPDISFISGDANYLLLKSSKFSKQTVEFLLKKYRIAVRSCANFTGLNSNFIRIAVKNKSDNTLLLNALKDYFAISNKIDFTIKDFYYKPNNKKPSIMLQGTCSDAGKSILTSAFCRIMLQDGYNIAPFKAQNMSLNSFVTSNGKEMGRAQVVQAEACRLAPDVRMNPILLKPSSDTGSQVIVNGLPLKNMTAKSYYRHKKELFNEVKKAYDSLSSEHDLMILEGAGSPAEINLKANDIVNMNMAKYANSNVLLTGDIDRGGVYASFLGCYATFDAAERKLLKGFLINKFRGDQSLLEPANKFLHNATKHPGYRCYSFYKKS